MQNPNGQEWNQDIQLPTHDLLFEDDKNKTSVPRNRNWTHQPLCDNLIVRPRRDQMERQKEKGNKCATIKTHLYKFRHFSTLTESRIHSYRQTSKSLPGFWYFTNSDSSSVSSSETETKTLKVSEQKPAPVL